jgi:hypothetical protein
MSPAAKALFELVPYVFAFAVGALIPKKHGALQRVALGVVSVLALALVFGLWPDKPGTVDAT